MACSWFGPGCPGLFVGSAGFPVVPFRWSGWSVLFPVRLAFLSLGLIHVWRVSVTLPLEFPVLAFLPDCPLHLSALRRAVTTGAVPLALFRARLLVPYLRSPCLCVAVSRHSWTTAGRTHVNSGSPTTTITVPFRPNSCPAARTVTSTRPSPVTVTSPPSTNSRPHQPAPTYATQFPDTPTPSTTSPGTTQRTPTQTHAPTTKPHQTTPNAHKRPKKRPTRPNIGPVGNCLARRWRRGLPGICRNGGFPPLFSAACNPRLPHGARYEGTTGPGRLLGDPYRVGCA